MRCVATSEVTGDFGGVWRLRRCVAGRRCVEVCGGVWRPARRRRPLIRQAVLPPNPDQTTRARCRRLVLGAYLANFSGFFFALFFFRDHCSWIRLKRIRLTRIGVLVSRYRGSWIL